MQKAALRSEFRSRRAALSNEIRTEWEQMLWGQLFSKLEALKTAKILLFYFPLPHEISLLPVFGYARERGIPCAFPRCGEATGDMDFYFVSSLDELECGKYGIREPKSSAEKVTNFSGAAVFVPALAFDREGYRLGYGGGYYDRFIAAHDVLSVGITYEAFLTDALPRNQYDQAVDLIVTEKRIYRNKF
jgi:5-formyltetrahydrofolate cyclo-ligase